MRVHHVWIVATGCACQPQVDVPRWEPLDSARVRATVENPTARFAEDPGLMRLQEILVGPSAAANLDAATADLRGLLDQEGPATEGSGMDDSTQVSESPGEGTAVFLRVACAGPFPEEPDRTFAFGHIRVDSPVLTTDVIENLAVEGDLLLSFVGCSFGGVTYDGSAPSSYEAGETAQLLTSLSLNALDELTGVAEPFEQDAILEPMRSRFAQPSAGGGTYTLDIDAQSGTTSLRAADGVLQCVTSTGACTGP